ncbi:Anthranilate synthase component 1 [uncultured archaeon]|nr:Anthranilate synthase component 1 [uncultured archaeon]
MISKKLKLNLNPYQLYLLVNREYSESFLLESLEGKEKLARFSFIGFQPNKHVSAKKNVVSIEGQEEDSKNPLRTLAGCMPRIDTPIEGFAGGAVGYVSYDYARNLEKLPQKAKDDAKFPDFEFGIFEDAIAYDHRDRTITYLSHGQDRSQDILKLTKEDAFFGPFEAGNAKPSMEKEKFETAVDAAKEKIASGDIFQVVLSRRHEFPFEGNILGFYNRLKHINPSPYMYFLSFGERKIIGSSPENLVRVEGRKIDSYATLAGTRERGKTPQEDALLEKELLKDPKERAEHLMLVDLTRNNV